MIPARTCNMYDLDDYTNMQYVYESMYTAVIINRRIYK